MFSTFKKDLQERFKQIIEGQTTLYIVNTDKDLMWETYLNSFPESERQEHTCNACRQFIKTYGSIVALKDNMIQTIWDIKTVQPFQSVASHLNLRVKSAAIKDVFVTDTQKLGTDSSKELNEDKTITVWQHMFVTLPKTFVRASNAISDDTIKAGFRDKKQVLKRALDELTIDASETILELIGQGSLYRGDEHKYAVTEFLKLQKEYKNLKANERDNYCWEKSVIVGGNISGIRNTSIGALLIKISEGEDLDAAVTFFEKSVMAPSNYKRPTAIVTKKMVEDAEKLIEELGFQESLGRRFAIPSDIKVNNLLFVDRGVKKLSSLLGELKEDIAINPKTLSKVEEVTINKFIDTILPNATGIEVLLENQHTGNMVSLIASSIVDSPSLFKWPNGFSWSYNNAVADSMAQRVVDAGGRIDGAFRFTHSWNEIEPNQSLMDLHVFMPGCTVPNTGGGPIVTGRRVGWNQRKDSLSGGEQDVDYTSAAPVGYIPIENITFPDIKRMPEGVYTCKIHNWSFRGTGGQGKAEIAFGGELYQYIYPTTRNGQWVTVAKVTMKNGQFTIDHKLPVDNMISKDLWTIKTNRFHKVSMVMKSPNFWDGNSVGNQHTFFIIDGAHNDEQVRGFFNEFLREDLVKHKRVFEALGSKMKVEPADKQVSGIGFSSTTRGDIVVKVSGSFNRMLRIRF